MLDPQILELQKRVVELELRNKRVEASKKWETSRFRIFSITALTYFVMVLAFWQIDSEKAFIQAIIPTLGYLLSTLSLSWINKMFK